MSASPGSRDEPGECLPPDRDAGPPLVSIVIPAYNYAEFLAQAIDSVLLQDYPRVQLIVIDDGSTDGTGAVLKRYEGKGTILRQDNRGQAATLNRGWMMAGGDYLGYLSADDTLDPSAVNRLVEALEGNPRAILAYPDFRLIDPGSSPIRQVRTPEFRYEDMLVKLVCPPGPGALFRRRSFLAAGGWSPEYRQMPDFDYWLRLGLLGEFVRVPRVLASFRVHERSQTFAAVSPARADEPIRIVSAAFENERLPAELAGLRDRALSNALILSAQLHLRAGRTLAAWARVRRAAAIFPRNLMSLQSARAFINALFSRNAHRLRWTCRRALRAITGTGPAAGRRQSG